MIPLILATVTVVGAAIYHARESSIIGAPSLCRDPDNISSHVYNPAGLQAVKNCATVSGIVESVIAEDD